MTTTCPTSESNTISLRSWWHSLHSRRADKAKMAPIALHTLQEAHIQTSGMQMLMKQSHKEMYQISLPHPQLLLPATAQINREYAWIVIHSVLSRPYSITVSTTITYVPDMRETVKNLVNAHEHIQDEQQRTRAKIMDLKDNSHRSNVKTRGISETILPSNLNA